MDTHQGYYKNLVEYCKNMPCPCAHQIDLDLRRTFPYDEKCMQEEFLLKMRNILLSYSIRNITVGYCQGMNFLVARLLLVMENEEEVFWIFVQILENILSLLNYQEITGVIIETTLIETLISYYLPELNSFLNKKDFKVSLSNFIHKWIVCLFSQTLKPEMIYSLYDFFFIDGFTTMIKASIFILTCIQKEVLQKKTFRDIYSIFIDVENKVINPKNMIFFICQKKFRINKDDINQYMKLLQGPIINNLNTSDLKYNVRRTAEEQKALLKSKNIYCNPNWPFCLYQPSLFDMKEVLILKESKPPYIIDDYYYIKNEEYHDEKNDFIDGELILDKTSNIEILIERGKHVCDDQKIVEISQNFSKQEKNIQNENGDLGQDKSIEMKIYELLKNSKDVDKITRYIYLILNQKEEKTILKNEIDIINEKNKEFIYYTKDYFKKG